MAAGVCKASRARFEGGVLTRWLPVDGVLWVRGLLAREVVGILEDLMGENSPPRHALLLSLCSIRLTSLLPCFFPGVGTL